MAAGAPVAALVACPPKLGGDPMLVGGEACRLDACEVLIAGRLDGLAAIYRREEPIAEVIETTNIKSGESSRA